MQSYFSIKMLFHPPSYLFRQSISTGFAQTLDDVFALLSDIVRANKVDGSSAFSLDLCLNLRTRYLPFNDSVRKICRTKRRRCDDIASRDILFVSAVESIRFYRTFRRSSGQFIRCRLLCRRKNLLSNAHAT